MVGDDVEQNPRAQPVRFRKQGLELFHGAEHWGHAAAAKLFGGPAKQWPARSSASETAQLQR